MKRTPILYNKDDFEHYDPSQELIFPPNLKISSKKDPENLCFESSRVTFYRPATLQTLLQLKDKFPSARLVGGNTEIGVEVEYKNQFYPVLVDISQVADLLQMSVSEQSVNIGSAVPLSVIEKELIGITRNKSKGRNQVLTEIISMLKLFAGRQIRNVATLGGNIMTGSPISDLNPIFMAVNAHLCLRSVSGERKVPMNERFYSGYRKNISAVNEVLVSVEIPFTNENECFRAYKQARRREDDIAIVNAAFRVKFVPDSDVVSDIGIAFGGMAPTTVLALRTMQKLKGQSWTKSLDLGLSSLRDELKLHPSAPGGMVEYRLALVLSFFFKFHMEAMNLLQQNGNLTENGPPTDLSSIVPFEIPPPRSMQFFQEIPPSQEAIDPIGRPIASVSCLKQATGEALFVDDIPEYKDELQAALILSTKAHAKIISIDITSALKLEGVEGVYTAKDLSDERNVLAFGVIRDEVFFASGRVNCVGQVVGTVVAQTASIARRAAKLVAIEYEELPNPIITIQDAIKASSYLGDPLVIHKGDLDKGFQKSDKILHGQFSMGGQEHFYLEPNSNIAISRDVDEIELTSTTQCLEMTQRVTAHMLGLPENKVVCKIKRLGGGFGGKEFRSSPIGAVVAFAAKKCGRPVRLVLNRHEDMLITGGRHPFYARWKVGFEKSGRIQCLEADLYSNSGWSSDLSHAIMSRALMSMDNAYRIENLKFSGRSCKTNLPSNTAFRGFGGPQGMAFMEDIVSKIADALNEDPTKVREINFYKANGDVSHMGIPLEDCTIRRCWEEVILSSNYEARKKRIQEYNKNSPYKKKGISVIPTKYGISFTATFLNQSGALVHIYRDGSVLLTHGGVEMGQGLHTKMIQVAARVLGVPMDKIHISETSTDKVPNTSPSAASASSDLNGMAVIDACEKLNKVLKPYKEKNPSGPWEKWVNSAYFDRVSLFASGFYATPGIELFDFKTQKGRCFNYFTYGAAVSEVEVDCLTGDHWTVRSDIVMDLGNSLNPAIDIGQVEGAFAQGLGLFTLEELKYFPDGNLFTKGPGAYKLPGSHDIPRTFNVSLLRDSKNPRAVYSSKAVGEPPLFLAMSVFFAIKEAIKSYRRDNERATSFEFNSPATAENIRMAALDRITDSIGPQEGNDKPWFLSVQS